MKYIVWSLVGLLVVLHQDYWQWSNATLDFGFSPRALTYHACLSLAAAVVWVLATIFCWPKGLHDSEAGSKPEDAEA
jgi:formate hydrogenlyase subunit 3/multisubunit Na+/H+ antiporter MnhD subunit